MVMVEGWLRAIVREKTRCGIVLVGGVGGWVSPRGKRGGRRSGRAEGDGEDVEVPVAAFSMLWPLVSGPSASPLLRSIFGKIAYTRKCTRALALLVGVGTPKGCIRSGGR